MKHESHILKRIKTYLMHRRSGEDAHEFELDMERDPFLYEAMQGYDSMLASEVQQALNELDDKLENKSVIIASKKKWIAAAGVALVGVGLLAWVFWTPNSEDTTSVEEKSYRSRDIIPRFERIAAPAPQKEPTETGADTQDGPNKNTSGVELPENHIEEPATEDQPKVAATTDSGISTSDENTGITKVGNPDSHNAASGPGALNAQPDGSDAGGETTGNLSQDDTAAPSVQNNPRVEAPAKTMIDQENPLEFEPVIGFAEYNRYVKENLVVSETMPSGFVELSFEIDRNGKPKKIKVEHSLCTACDAEAVRLISQGPPWETKNRKGRVRYRIPFE
ncbi:MAG: hypothetical protein Kow0075_10120 [Salibacteraceae bacterium]